MQKIIFLVLVTLLGCTKEPPTTTTGRAIPLMRKEHLGITPEVEQRIKVRTIKDLNLDPVTPPERPMTLTAHDY